MNRLKNNKSRNLKASVLLTLLLLLCLWGLVAKSTAQEAQKHKVDTNALINETQKISSETGRMNLVWWVPEEYWRVTFEQDPTMTPEGTEQFLKAFRPYTLIIVVDGKMGPFGGVTYKSRAELVADIKIKDKYGNSFRPLGEDKISPDLKNFLMMMKPIFSNMLGPMGENMHFFVFDANNKAGEKIADAQKEGSFEVILGTGQFRWRLPLGSLLAPKLCSNCKEKCNGAWNFCPWCGTRLAKQN